MNPAIRAALEADLASRAFAAPPDVSLTPRRVGAEVELIPLDKATGRRCPLEPSAQGATPFAFGASCSITMATASAMSVP